MDTCELLAELEDVIAKVVVADAHIPFVIGLWVAMTYLVEQTQVLPLLAIMAPEKRCGKTVTLEVVARLAHRPLIAAHATAAALFRVTEEWAPTILLDEIDSFIRDNEELRGLLNSGHTRSAAGVLRCVGDSNEPRLFCTYAPKALAGIGKLSDTLQDRAIVVPLQRKLRDHEVARPSDLATEAVRLTRRLTRWAADRPSILSDCPLEPPRELDDRAADNWRHLLSIACEACPACLRRAREASLLMSGKQDFDDASTHVLLLRDSREVFEKSGRARLTPTELIKGLMDLEESPWATMKQGNGPSARFLANQLRKYGIQSKGTRLPGVPNTVRAYHRADFEESWSRYLSTDVDGEKYSVASPYEAGLQSVNKGNNEPDPLLPGDHAVDRSQRPTVNGKSAVDGSEFYPSTENIELLQGVRGHSAPLLTDTMRTGAQSGRGDVLEDPEPFDAPPPPTDEDAPPNIY